MHQGKIEGARKSYEEAQSLDKRATGGLADLEIKVAFARLNLVGGDLEEAATDARLALAGFTRSGREGDRLMAAAILARALVAEGKGQQAAEAIIQLPAPDARTLPVWVSLQFQIARADCLAHSGKSAEAARMMDSAASTMFRMGLPGLEKEAAEAKQAFLKVGSMRITSR